MCSCRHGLPTAQGRRACGGALEVDKDTAQVHGYKAWQRPRRRGGRAGRACLQEALHASARVLGALPVVAVRQQHHQAALAQPLGLAAAHELVKDDLRGGQPGAHVDERRAEVGTCTGCSADGAAECICRSLCRSPATHQQTGKEARLSGATSSPGQLSPGTAVALLPARRWQSLRTAPPR